MAYTPTGKPLDGSRGIAAVVRDEFQLVADGATASFHNPTFTGTTTMDIATATSPSAATSGGRVATMNAVHDAIAEASSMSAPVVIPFIALYQR